jgi:amidohydrolase
MKNIDKDILDYFQNIKTYRRHIHANPEVGPEQPNTVKYVKEQFSSLEDILITHGEEKAGIVIDIICSEDGPTIAFRADMDALNVSETKSTEHLPNKENFCSMFENKMHACGHDMHTAILIGFGKIIHKHRDNLKGKIRLLFQPGEEGYGGGKKMVEANYLEDVQNVFALHCWPNLEVGQIGFRKGAFFASVDHFLVKVNGIGGHGASPEKASDQILAVSSMISNLQVILARKLSGLDQRILSIGYINAGNKKSGGVLPSSAEFGGTFRTFDDKVKLKIKEELKTICEYTASMIHKDCKVEIEYTNSYPQTINSDAMVEKVENIFSTFIEEKNLFPNFIPTLGAEDFSYMLKEVPGVLFLIGTTTFSNDISKSVFLHNPTFDPDEQSLLYGVQAFKSIVFNFLSKK